MNITLTQIIQFGKTALSGVLLFLLLRSISWGGMIASLSRANLGWCVFTLVASIGTIFVSAWRWQLLQKAVGIEPPHFMRLVYYYFIGYFFNNFAPANIAGDAMRASALYRQGENVAAATASVVLERLLNLVTLGVMFLWVLLMRPLPINFDINIFYAKIVGFAVFLGAALCFWLWRHPPIFLRSWIFQIYTLLSNIKDNPRQIGNAVIFTLLIHFVTMLIVFGALRAVLISLPLFIHLAVYVIAGLILTFPISIQGIGVREGIYVGLFGLVGVKSEQVIAALGISYIILILFSLIGGLLFWMNSRKARPQAT